MLANFQHVINIPYVPYRTDQLTDWLNLRTVHPQQNQTHARKRKQRVYSSLTRKSRLERNWDIDGTMMGWKGQGRGEGGGSALHEWARADLTSNAANEQMLQIKHHRSSIYFREDPISKLPSTPQEKIVVHDDLHSKASPHHWPYVYALSNERRNYARGRARRVYMWVKPAKQITHSIHTYIQIRNKNEAPRDWNLWRGSAAQEWAEEGVRKLPTRDSRSSANTWLHHTQT